MKVQSRLTLYNSLVFGMVFIIVGSLAYYLYSGNTKKSLYANLAKTAHIAALFYLEEDELNSEEFAKVRSQFNEFVNNSYYQLYNEQDSVIYGSSFHRLPAATLDRIHREKSMAFIDGDFFCYAIFYEDNQGDFVIVAREKQEFVRDQLRTLLWIMVTGFAMGIIVITAISRWLANLAYRPFRKVIRQVRRISTDKLDRRIALPDTRDELQDLTETFNDLLERIAETFVIQKNFARYVSHEFKTPLAAMQGNLEVFALKDRSADEYRDLSRKLVRDIGQLGDILDTLNVISDLRSPSDNLSSTRIDELVWEITENILQENPDAEITVDIDVPADMEHLLNVSVDRMQLLLVLYNLIGNAVKFSEFKPVEILIRNEQDSLKLVITDHGIGIPRDQLEHISKPFFRAANTEGVSGNGIGLSIALRILEKNNICYRIHSEVGMGTTVELEF